VKRHGPPPAGRLGPGNTVGMRAARFLMHGEEFAMRLLCEEAGFGMPLICKTAQVSAHCA
jgi:hypothetical protein